MFGTITHMYIGFHAEHSFASFADGTGSFCNDSLKLFYLGSGEKDCSNSRRVNVENESLCSSKQRRKTKCIALDCIKIDYGIEINGVYDMNCTQRNYTCIE